MDAIRFVSSIQSLFPGYNAGKPSCMYICIHILTKGASGITFTVLESFRYMSLAFLAYNAINLVVNVILPSFVHVVTYTVWLDEEDRPVGIAEDNEREEALETNSSSFRFWFTLSFIVWLVGVFALYLIKG